MNDHYGLFLQRIQKQMSTISGGGEVNLRNLDDVDRSTIGPNRYLAYNPTTKKFFFEDVSSTDILVSDGFTTAIANNVISVTNLPQDTLIGPIDSLRFDVNHDHTEDRVEGTLCWDPDDRTVNIVHPGGVVQQVGQETFVKIRNETGSLIEDGTVVRFDGASLNGGAARLEAAPFLADGSFPSLYILGVTTQDIENEDDGFVTVWG